MHGLTAKHNAKQTAVQIWIISYIFHMISLYGKIWTQQIGLAPNVWLHSSVGRASHRYRGGHGFESRWSPDYFQASSFQLLKLENLLRWSHFTFIYYRSTNMNYFIYISNAFMYYLEKDVVMQFSNHLLLYKRFINDIFLVWKGPKGNLLEFLSCLNSKNDRIKLMYVIERK